MGDRKEEMGAQCDKGQVTIVRQSVPLSHSVSSPWAASLAPSTEGGQMPCPALLCCALRWPHLPRMCEVLGLIPEEVSEL